MRIDVLTLFPEMFPGVLNASILGRATQGGFVEYFVHDIRPFADNKHRKVDDRPFGGGPGMVMMCQPLYDCVSAVEQLDERKALRVLLTPQGKRMEQRHVEQLANESRIVLIAGHYEGVDERVIEELNPLELSVGDYVVSGGEIPAMLLIDAIVRLLPGVLGHEDSASEDSFTATDQHGRRLLDCPHYTRPREWNSRTVPDILLSGDHQAVANWRQQQRLERTKTRRPELMNDEQNQ